MARPPVVAAEEAGVLAGASHPHPEQQPRPSVLQSSLPVVLAVAAFLLVSAFLLSPGLNFSLSVSFGDGQRPAQQVQIPLQQRVFLVSNSARLNVSRLEFGGPGDRFILFNDARPLNSSFFARVGRRQVTLLVRTRGGASYWAEERIRELGAAVNAVVLAEGDPHRITRALEGVGAEVLYWTSYQLLTALGIDYSPAKYPSTGFMGYMYARVELPSYEAVLVGFSGERSDGKAESFSMHDFPWEQEYYREHRVTVINTFDA